MTLTPAYGRDYKTAKAAKADFNDNKDFVVADLFSGGGRYANKQDLPKGTRVTLRFDGMRKVAVVTV